MLNGTIVVDGVHYAKTGCGVENAVNDAPKLGTSICTSRCIFIRFGL